MAGPILGEDIMDIFGKIKQSPPKVIEPGRESLPWPNVANEIEDYVQKEWPELCKVAWLWFTGSRIWRFMYDEPEKSGADLDVFITPHPKPFYLAESDPWTTKEQLNQTRGALISIGLVAPSPGAKMTTSLGGFIAYTKRGRVDYWLANSDAHHQIANYPYDTHGHCKAAYCPFWKSLIIHANPKATEDGAFQLKERRMLKYGSMEPK